MTFARHTRVRLTLNYNHASAGWIGVVKGERSVGTTLYHAIEFPEAFDGGTNCDGLTRRGHGAWIPARMLERPPS